jgi:DNA mismatch repair ATPase MutS
MAGVPHHAAESYLGSFWKRATGSRSGDQIEDPKQAKAWSSGP